MTGEGFRDEREDAPVDYQALGLEILSKMGPDGREALGIERAADLGSLAVSAGDPEGNCVGTLAEAVGRHGAVRANVELIVQDAIQRDVDPGEAALANPFFNPYIAKDEKGQPFRVEPGEDVKKN